MSTHQLSSQHSRGHEGSWLSEQKALGLCLACSELEWGIVHSTLPLRPQHKGASGGSPAPSLTPTSLSNSCFSHKSLAILGTNKNISYQCQYLFTVSQDPDSILTSYPWTESSLRTQPRPKAPAASAPWFLAVHSASFTHC